MFDICICRNYGDQFESSTFTVKKKQPLPLPVSKYLDVQSCEVGGSDSEKEYTFAPLSGNLTKQKEQKKASPMLWFVFFFCCYYSIQSCAYIGFWRR